MGRVTEACLQEAAMTQMPSWFEQRCNLTFLPASLWVCEGCGVQGVRECSKSWFPKGAKQELGGGGTNPTSEDSSGMPENLVMASFLDLCKQSLQALGTQELAFLEMQL